MSNIILSDPMTVVLVTILVSLGFALIAKLSGETNPDPNAGDLPWGGPASRLVNYTIYVGLFIFLTTIGLHWLLALLVIVVWLFMEAYSVRMLHPIVDELLERYKAKKQTHSTANITPTKHDQDPPQRWV